MLLSLAKLTYWLGVIAGIVWPLLCNAYHYATYAHNRLGNRPEPLEMS